MQLLLASGSQWSQCVKWVWRRPDIHYVKRYAQSFKIWRYVKLTNSSHKKVIGSMLQSSTYWYKYAEKIYQLIFLF